MIVLTSTYGPGESLTVHLGGFKPSDWCFICGSGQVSLHSSILTISFPIAGLPWGWGFLHYCVSISPDVFYVNCCVCVDVDFVWMWEEVGSGSYCSSILDLLASCFSNLYLRSVLVISHMYVSRHHCFNAESECKERLNWSLMGVASIAQPRILSDGRIAPIKENAVNVEDNWLITFVSYTNG